MTALRCLGALAFAAALFLVPVLAADPAGTGSGGWGNVPSSPAGVRSSSASAGPRLVMEQEISQDLKLRLPETMNGAIAFLGELPGAITFETQRGTLVLRGKGLVQLAHAGVTHAQLMFVAPTQQTIVGDLYFITSTVADVTKGKLVVVFP